MYKNIEDMPLVMTVPEVAEFLCIGTSLVYQMVRSGELPSKKLGRRGQIRISKYALEAFLADVGA